MGRQDRRQALAAIRVAVATAGLAGLPLNGVAAPPAGAAACSGCHAPPDAASPVPAIQGRDAGEIATALQEFRSGRRPATVMDRIARGFSDEESRAMAAWLAEQPRR